MGVGASMLVTAQGVHAAAIPPPPQVGACADCIGTDTGNLRRLSQTLAPTAHNAPSDKRQMLIRSIRSGESETTLNVCDEEAASCVSTQNDDEAHFLAPWSAGSCNETSPCSEVRHASGVMAAVLPFVRWCLR